MAHKALKKRYHHGFWNRYFFSNLNTHLALPWTLLFVALRLSPNMVTWLSFAASGAGMALLVMQSDFWTGPVLGAFLLMLGIWWDHSDGQVARLTGKGTPFGALLDTILDRWVETGWVLALGIGLYTASGPAAFDWPAWAPLLVAVAATHSTLYVRWSNIQKDLYLLQAEIKRSQVQGHPGRLEVPTQTKHAGKMSPVTTFWLPFSFNRDVSLWMLAAVTLSPDWVVGLGVFALLHALRGLEKNWYTRGDLKRNDARMVAALLDHDYHK